jgi:cytochrome c-type biogenesis protein
VLAAILFVAGSEGSALKGAALLAAYSLGIGLPFLLAALFASRFLDFAARFRRHMGTVEKVMGAMLVVTGILFMTGSMSAISQWILETFPTLATVG